VFHGSLIGELLHLKSYRREGGAFTYICGNQQSVQCLDRRIGNHRMRSGLRLRAIDARTPPPQACQDSFDRVSQSQEELPKLSKHQNRAAYKALEDNG
jgi:hypothetical protein